MSKFFNLDDYSGEIDWDHIRVPDPDVAQPLRLRDVLDWMVDKCIVRLEEFVDPGPHGGASFGFRFREHDRIAWTMAPELDPRGYCAHALPMQWPPESIVTGSMEWRATHDRPEDRPGVGPNKLRFYRRIEGVHILSWQMDSANTEGGLRLTLGLEGDEFLHIDPLPGSAHGMASLFTARYMLTHVPNRRRIVTGPGTPLVVLP